MANGIAAKNQPKVKPGGGFKEAMTRASRFIREAWIEVRYKASWPNWTELKRFTGVVILAVVIVGIWIGGLDYILGKITELLIKR